MTDPGCHYSLKGLTHITREKKSERIFWMSQIVRDGRFNNFPFGLVDSDVVDAIKGLPQGG
jgi:hypothetical protein